MKINKPYQIWNFTKYNPDFIINKGDQLIIPNFQGNGICKTLVKSIIEGTQYNVNTYIETDKFGIISESYLESINESNK